MGRRSNEKWPCLHTPSSAFMLRAEKAVMAKSERLLFHSRLPPVALAHKILDLIGKSDNARAAEGVIGNGNEQKMSLYVKRAEAMPITEFAATLHPEGSGTRIEGRIGASLSFTSLKILFFGLGLLGFIIALYDIISGPVSGRIIFMIVPIFLWTHLFDVMRQAKSDAPGDRQKILDFIHAHLELAAREDGLAPSQELRE